MDAGGEGGGRKGKYTFHGKGTIYSEENIDAHHAFHGKGTLYSEENIDAHHVGGKLYVNTHVDIHSDMEVYTAG